MSKNNIVEPNFEVTSLKEEYTKDLLTRMKEVLEQDTTLYIHKDDGGMFYTEIYADYRDEMDDKTVKEIMNAKCPMDYFTDFMFECYEDAEWEEEKSVLDMLSADEKIQNLLDKIGENEDNLRDYLMDMFYVKLPEEHYLKQDIKVDILVDTGDANYDYTLNDVYPHYDGQIDDTIDNKASIIWLAKQQGYKKSDLNKALKDEEYDNSKLLKSLHSEVLNCSSNMNVLTFCVEMTLEELINLNEKIKEEEPLNTSCNPKERKGRGYITIDKDTTCGLYDPWNGSGSVLEIDLEKDVRLPIRYIDSALPDGCKGCSINEIYCPINIWSNGKVA